MYLLLSLMIDIGAGFLSVLPFLILLEILARKQIPFISLRHLACDGIFCFFLSAILAVTGIPAVYDFHPDITVNLRPFADLPDNALQYIENLLLFLPVGLLLPTLFPKYRNALRCTGYGFLFSLAVELLQLLSFRTTDIDDLLMNTLGCLAGYGLFQLFCHLFPTLSSTFVLPSEEDFDTAAQLSVHKEKLPALFELEAYFLTAASWAGALLLTSGIQDLIWSLIYSF